MSGWILVEVGCAECGVPGPLAEVAGFYDTADAAKAAAVAVRSWADLDARIGRHVERGWDEYPGVGWVAGYVGGDGQSWVAPATMFDRPD